MRNITVSVDEETHRLARVRAAELDTSLSALVRGYLQSLAKDGTRVGDEAVGERRARLLREAVAGFDARGVGLDPRQNLTLEELYDEAIDSQNALR